MLPWLQSLFRVVFACSTSTIFIWSARQPEWNQTAGNRPLPQKPKATPALDPDIMILILTLTFDMTFDLTFLERGVGATNQGMKDLVVWGQGGWWGGRAGGEKKMWVGEGSH